MAGKTSRLLVVASRTGRVGCVFLINKRLIDWANSDKAATSPQEAAEQLRRWIGHYRPDCLASENPEAAGRKSAKQKAILKAFVEIGEEMNIPHILVARKKTHRNLYRAAEALAQTYPDIAPWVPKKPAIWLPEARNLIYFEALGLAQLALEG